MSIVASIKVYDGIVLGADSLSQLTGTTPSGEIQYIQTFQHAQKLFEVEKHPIGILTYGIATIGNRSIESYIIDFKNSLVTEIDSGRVQPTVQSITEFLLQSLLTPYNEAYSNIPENQRSPELGVFVAGYSEGEPLGDEWEFAIPRISQARRVERPGSGYGASWRGISIPFSRLYNGIDPRVWNVLQAQNVPQETIDALRNVVKQFQSPIAFDGMPVQDAINFCEFILSTTVDMATFEVGVPTCGFPLDIAAITRTGGFNWVNKKQYQVKNKSQ